MDYGYGLRVAVPAIKAPSAASVLRSGLSVSLVGYLKTNAVKVTLTYPQFKICISINIWLYDECVAYLVCIHVVCVSLI